MGNHQRSAQADETLISTLFPYGSFGDPSFVTTSVGRFEPTFLQFLEHYVSEKESTDIWNMSIRDVLNEFVPLWRGFHFGDTMQRKLAQNTFTYLLRHHPDWEFLAKQVLSGHDEDCRAMTGFPIDLTPHELEYSYQTRLGQTYFAQRLTSHFSQIIF